MKARRNFSLRLFLYLPAIAALSLAVVFLPAMRLTWAIERLEKAGVHVVRKDSSSIATIFVGMRSYHVSVTEPNEHCLEQLLPKIPHIESAAFRFPGENFACIVSLMPDLSELEVEEANDLLLEPIVNLNALTHVKISGLQFRGTDLVLLSALPSLSSVDLSETSISDESIKVFSEFPAIEHLSLADTTVSDKGISYLEKIRLKSLNLDGTAISKSGVMLLADFVGLESLSSRSAALSDNDFKCFVGSNIQASLRFLLINSLHIDSNGKSELRMSLPNCEVYSRFTVVESVFQESIDLSGLGVLSQALREEE